MFFIKEYRPYSNARSYSIQILFCLTTFLADPEPGAGAETSMFQLWPKVPAPCSSGSTTLDAVYIHKLPGNL
jgi:hypothetical protein